MTGEKASERCQVSIEEMSESKPNDDASLNSQVLSKLEPCSCSRMSREGTCLRSRRQPVYRRHELDIGFGMERENLIGDGKGKGPSAGNARPKYQCFDQGRIIL
jgi:hypothetical protein